VRPHVPEDELHAYCDGELSPAQRAEIASHLLGCLICRAQHAEVESLRARVVQLLGAAVPRAARAVPAVRYGRVMSWRRGAAVAAAALLIATGAWLVGGGRQHVAPQLAGTFVTPALMASAADQSTAPSPAAVKQRNLTLASRPGVRPEVLPGAIGLAPRQRPEMDQSTAVDPVEYAGWEVVSTDTALAEGQGAFTRLPGMPITAIRLHRTGTGVRPTFMVRQQLADGRSVWVLEGSVDDIGAISHTLEASGLTHSMPLRARPDYVDNTTGPMQTTRMVMIAAYLPNDSLDALAARLMRH
jgi:Putative zinc-finger